MRISKILAALRAARFASVSEGSKSFKVIKGSFSLSENSRNSPFLSSKTAFFSTYLPRSLGESLLLTYSLQSYAHGLGQDGPGILENPQTNPGLHPEQCLFQQFCPEIRPWGCPCSGPTPGCLWPWTWPRWSWRSGKTLNLQSFTC